MITFQVMSELANFNQKNKSTLSTSGKVLKYKYSRLEQVAKDPMTKINTCTLDN